MRVGLREVLRGELREVLRWLLMDEDRELLRELRGVRELLRELLGVELRELFRVELREDLNRSVSWYSVISASGGQTEATA